MFCATLPSRMGKSKLVVEEWVDFRLPFGVRDVSPMEAASETRLCNCNRAKSHGPSRRGVTNMAQSLRHCECVWGTPGEGWRNAPCTCSKDPPPSGSCGSRDTTCRRIVGRPRKLRLHALFAGACEPYELQSFGSASREEHAHNSVGVLHCQCRKLSCLRTRVGIGPSLLSARREP